MTVDSIFMNRWRSIFISSRNTAPEKRSHLKDAREEALATQWSFWVMTEVEKPLVTILLHVLGMLPSDEATLESCGKDLERPSRDRGGILATEQPYLGKSFTVADLNVASVMAWSMPAKFDLSAYPRAAFRLAKALSFAAGFQSDRRGRLGLGRKCYLCLRYETCMCRNGPRCSGASETLPDPNV